MAVTIKELTMNLKKYTLPFALLAVATLVGCGDDSSSSPSGKSSKVPSSVQTFEDLDAVECDADVKCETIEVEEDGDTYECDGDGSWKLVVEGYESAVCSADDGEDGEDGDDGKAEAGKKDGEKDGPEADEKDDGEKDGPEADEKDDGEKQGPGAEKKDEGNAEGDDAVEGDDEKQGPGAEKKDEGEKQGPGAEKKDGNEKQGPGAEKKDETTVETDDEGGETGEVVAAED